MNEILRVGETRAVGRLVLFSGVLVWFCHDYFVNWFGADFSRGVAKFDALLISRAATMHCLFVAALVAGWSLLPESTFLERLIRKVPEPQPRNRYLFLVILLFALGTIPAAVQAQGGGSFQRTGNLNYNWGAYIHELTKVGKFGAIVAAAHALLVARSMPSRLISWSIWLYWVHQAFLTGRRGHVVSVVMPVGLLLLLEHRPARLNGVRFPSKRRLVLAAMLLVASLAVIQVQGRFRDTAGELRYQNVSKVELTELRGNDMFSTTLSGFSLIPRTQPFFYDNLVGETLVRPLPEFLFRFLIHPIPRALWRDKPVDPVWSWYRYVVAGASGVGGTTISTGLVGWWYFRFGVLGVLQGGLLFGWLYRCGDKLFISFANSPMRILLSLAYFAWLFRCFRDVAIVEFYAFAVSAVFLRYLIPMINGRSRTAEAR